MDLKLAMIITSYLQMDVHQHAILSQLILVSELELILVLFVETV